MQWIFYFNLRYNDYKKAARWFGQRGRPGLAIGVILRLGQDVFDVQPFGFDGCVG